MKIGDITATLVKKAVVNVIYKEWLHEGHIDIEHTEDFRCVIDGKLYEITVREVGNDIGTDYEAYKIALTALRPVSREQVEKVWRGCRSCKSCRSCAYSIYDLKDVPCKMCDPNAEGIVTEYKPSNFCPVCGKPLTDEAVEMVMRRLEAMYGEAKAD